jgi:hypothetical protein
MPACPLRRSRCGALQLGWLLLRVVVVVVHGLSCADTACLLFKGWVPPPDCQERRDRASLPPVMRSSAHLRVLEAGETRA